MKTTTTSRIGASIAALVLATGAALATAGPASAATTVGSVTWYGSGDFGTETTAYPGTDWFFGAIGGGFTAAPGQFLADGLNVTTTAAQKFQALTNLAALSPDGPVTLETHVNSLRVQSPGTNWSLQVPIFGSGTAQFTTIRPTTDGTQGTAATAWTTSQNIYIDDAGDPLDPATIAIPAGTSTSLAAISAALFGGTAPRVLAAGVYVDPSQTAVINGFWVGEQYSAFSPVVTRTVTPNPVSPAQATTTGVTFTGSGWLPGSTVYIAIYVCSEGELASEPIFLDESTVAAADGTVNFTAILAEAPAVGTYCVDFDDDSNENEPFWSLDGMPPLELTVANVLPATGLEVTAPIVGGIAFLIIGGIALAATRKVERTSD